MNQERPSRGFNLNSVLLSFIMLFLSASGVIGWSIMQKSTTTGEDVAAIKIQVGNIQAAQASAIPRLEVEASLAGIKADMARYGVENNEIRLRLTQIEIAVARMAK